MIEIDCPDCKGAKYIPDWHDTLLSNPCDTCKANGKIKVYTQAEVQKLKDALDKMLHTNTYIDRLMIVRKIWNEDGE